MRRFFLFPTAALSFVTAVATAQQPLEQPKIVIPSFGMSYQLIALASRPEVQNALDMSQQQRNAIAELDPRKHLPTRPPAQKRFDGPSSNQDIQAHVDSLAASHRAAGDDKLKAILKPEQMKRLLELDLQWRGPLALSDPKVAERLDISADHKNKINAAAGEFNHVRSELLSQAMTMDQSAGIIKVDTSAMDNPLTPVGKKYAEACKTAEERVLKALSGEEKARFKKSQGEAFVFRKDRPGIK